MKEWVGEYTNVICITLSYLAVYYALMINGLRVKLRVARQCKEEGKPFLRYSNVYPELLASDRHQLNMLEHMPPFLLLLWLQALVVSTASATALGAAYVVIRATYPLFVGHELRTSIKPHVFINTFAGYGILVTFATWQMVTLLQ